MIREEQGESVARVENIKSVEKRCLELDKDYWARV